MPKTGKHHVGKVGTEVHLLVFSNGNNKLASQCKGRYILLERDNVDPRPDGPF